MERRSFLQLVVGAGISVVVPDLWVPPMEHLPKLQVLNELCRVSAPADSVMEILLCGKGNSSEVATFDVVRPNGEKMLALAFNTFGGLLRWVAAPGEELPAPLQFVFSDANMAVNVVGKKGDQYSFSVLEPPFASHPPVLIPRDNDSGLVPNSAITRRELIPDVFKDAWRIG